MGRDVIVMTSLSQIGNPIMDGGYRTEVAG